MANYIKYSTNAQTRALKMGNFWLGPVNDGKGSTSSTGYYTALNPPSGGFTIYLNKASNGPSIYQASNESQLVSITNQIGGTSFTTSAQCLTWYVTQTDKFCVNRDYEGIVTNGLVLNLDAGFTPSYPTSGTSWYDVSISGNTGTLTNGPTFSSTNGGSIVFDGVDDYVSGSGIKLTTQGTIITWFKTSNTYNNNYLFSLPIASVGSNGFDLGFGGTTSFRGVIGTTVSYAVLTYTTTYSDNNWHMGALTYNGTTATLYYDGVSRTSVTITGTLVPTANGEFNVGRFGSFGAYVAASISNATVYDRALSATEVLQNYNAMKSRFGL